MTPYTTESGILSNRTRYAAVYTMLGMAAPILTDVLWENILSGMIRKYGKQNQTKLVGDSGIGRGTISRIKGTGEQPRGTSVGIEVIEKIAMALGVPAWLLLFPGGSRIVAAADVEKFLEICQAWAQADQKGKEVLLTAAEIASSKYAASGGDQRDRAMPIDGR